jgi:WD40 repeat protein
MNLLASISLEGGQTTWSPDGQLLAVGTRSKVAVFSPLTDTTYRVFSPPEGWDNPLPQFGAVSFSPDGTQLAAGFTVIVAVWDAVSGELVKEYHNISGEVTSVAYSPDGNWIAASGMRGGFVSRTNTTVPTFWIDSAPDVTWSVAFSPDSRLIASTGPVGISIWDPSSGSLLQEIAGGGGFQLAFGPSPILSDGKNLWDATDGSLLRTLAPDTDAHQVSLALHPSGIIIALGFDDGSIRILDTANGTLLSTIVAHQGRVRGLAFSPDGRLLVSTGSDDAVRFWGLSSES